MSIAPCRHANASRPADFLDDDLTLNTNVIYNAAPPLEPPWASYTTIAMVESRIERGGTIQTERRSYIATLGEVATKTGRSTRRSSCCHCRSRNPLRLRGGKWVEIAIDSSTNACC